MKAKKQEWGGGTRIVLKDVLPMDTPLAVSFEASSFCNLKCSYCIHGIKTKPFVQKFMDFDVFKRSVDSLNCFPQKIKRIMFSLNGEPTTNRQLPEMVRYIKEKEAAKEVTVFTNGILLTPDYGERLIGAGLDVLRVSIQGLSDERYLELCGVKTDYQEIVNNISHFFNYKEKNGFACHVFIKIVDQSFSDEESEQKFYADFGDICDQISVETIVPMRLEVDYDNQVVNTEKNMLEQEAVHSDVCAQPFYSMYVHSDNRVTPCCIAEAGQLTIGDAEKQSLFDIWHSKELTSVRKKQLLKKRSEDSSCRECNYPSFGMQSSDRIDSIAEQLFKTLYEKEKW